ncbi:hypothetical protein AQF52_7012 [Streptomyces venezuelae]|nr:hypothetical protein AQF52_7012 [Streptomyces venezuelae]
MLQEADQVISRERLTARQLLYQRGRKLSLLFLGAAEIYAPLDQGRRETSKDFLTNALRDISLDLGIRQ